jgi:hypothetical protein
LKIFTKVLDFVEFLLTFVSQLAGRAFEVAIKKDESQKIYRGMEQLVARRAHNPKVTGSSPVPATKKETLVKS